MLSYNQAYWSLMIELLVNWEENGNFHLYAEQHQMITLLSSDCPLLLSFIANQVRLQLLNKYASTLWSSPQHSANKIRGRKVRNLSFQFGKQKCNLWGNINWNNVNNGLFTAVSITCGTKLVIRQGSAYPSLERFSEGVALECHTTFRKHP